MPAGETYIKLATQTVTSSSSSITFSNISLDYTDLVLVSSAKLTSGSNSTIVARVGYNGVSTSSYSYTYLQGAGDGATAATTSSATFMLLQGGNNAVPENSNTFGTFITHFMSYSDFVTNKTVLSRGNSVGGAPSQSGASVSVFKGATAINQIQIFPVVGSIDTGSTFTLYGIKSSFSPKAEGGIITYDTNYYYHTFLGTGVFEPIQDLNVDILCIAGGGSGGVQNAGGGGAGGLVYLSSQSMPIGSYNCLVGAGGAGNSLVPGYGINGNNSQFASLTAAVGGGAGGGGNTFGAYNGNPGGSGGGAGHTGSSTPGTGGSPVSGQGFAGGAGAGDYDGGGGGGAGAVGGNASTNVGGNGGSGTLNYSAWATATRTGVTSYYAGGGGGGGTSGFGSGGLGGGGRGGRESPLASATSGTANTGSGGGGARNPSGTGNGAGGSGIIIVRYLKA